MTQEIFQSISIFSKVLPVFQHIKFVSNMIYRGSVLTDEFFVAPDQ